MIRYSGNGKTNAIREDVFTKGYARLESSGYIAFEPDGQSTTKNLCDVYKRWCYDNAEKAVATSTFNRYLTQNAEDLKIRPNKNVRFDVGKYARFPSPYVR